MKKASKKKPDLSVAQICMTANFWDADADSDAGFKAITRRLLGSKGFKGEKHAVLFRKECYKAFKLGRPPSTRSSGRSTAYPNA